MAKTELGKKLVRLIDKAERWIQAGQEIRKELEDLKGEAEKGED